MSAIAGPGWGQPDRYHWFPFLVSFTISGNGIEGRHLGGRHCKPLTFYETERDNRKKESPCDTFLFYTTSKAESSPMDVM